MTAVTANILKSSDAIPQPSPVSDKAAPATSAKILSAKTWIAVFGATLAGSLFSTSTSFPVC